jgi:hypothetical protein
MCEFHACPEHRGYGTVLCCGELDGAFDIGRIDARAIEDVFDLNISVDLRVLLRLCRFDLHLESLKGNSLLSQNGGNITSGTSAKGEENKLLGTRSSVAASKSSGPSMETSAGISFCHECHTIANLLYDCLFTCHLWTFFSGSDRVVHP